MNALNNVVLGWKLILILSLYVLVMENMLVICCRHNVYDCHIEINRHHIKNVNYLELIPLLVDKIGDLQKQLTFLEEKILYLEK